MRGGAGRVPDARRTRHHAALRRAPDPGLARGGGHRRDWSLPWNGGGDGYQQLASVALKDAPGWTTPDPDAGTQRPLGDIQSLIMDTRYDVLDQVPVSGEEGSAHILLPALNEALWYHAAVERCERVGGDSSSTSGVRGTLGML